MFKVDIAQKQLRELTETSLKDFKLGEREDLQQWLRTNPDLISKHFDFDMKIISEEFGEFENSDRLDLLAVSSDGSLVVIELKRKDSGSTIDMQGLKYASYCSTLTPKRIVEVYQKYLDKCGVDLDAGEDLAAFLTSDTETDSSDLNNLNSEQKIVLVAQYFDPRVKSVVAWLGSQGIDIYCIQLKVFQDLDNKNLYIDSQMILPVEQISDYLVKDAGMLKSASSKQRVPQPESVIKFLDEYKKEIRDQFGLHARGTDYVKYRTFKAGKVGVEFAFEVMKSTKKYKINLLAKEPNIKLLEIFRMMMASVPAPQGYEFQFVDPANSDSKWERIVIFVEPRGAEYLNDASEMAKLTHDFIKWLNPVIEKLKAA